MLITLFTAALVVDALGGAPLRGGLLAGQLVAGWKAKKERDQFEEACREGFNPVRQKLTNERWQQAWRKVGEGPEFSIQMVYSRIDKADLEAARKVLLDDGNEDLLSVEELKFLLGEYLLTEEEAFLFEHGVKAHMKRTQHAVDFWWLKQVSEFRITNPKRADLVSAMREQDERSRRAA